MRTQRRKQQELQSVSCRSFVQLPLQERTVYLFGIPM
jgi:hypothetical protein